MSTPFSIILYSHTADAFYEAVSFAAAARARGRSVLLFLRGPAVKAFVDGHWAKPHDAKVERGLESQAVSPEELLAELRSKGKVHVYACSAWVRMLHVPAADAARRFDAVIGLNAFLTQSEGGQLLYI